MQNLSCQNISNLIPLYIEGKTTEEQTYEIMKHLEICAECREKYLSIKEISEKIKTAFDNIDKRQFDNDYKFFKENLSAYTDNELNKEDYFKFNSYVTSNPEANKELEEMMLFREQLQKVFSGQNFLEKDLSKDIIDTIREDEPEYFSNLLVKAAVITVFFILMTIIIGYLSVNENVPNLSEIKDKVFMTISVHSHQSEK